MKQLFTLQQQYHGRGQVVFSWHPQGSFLATCGSTGIVNIFNRQGEPRAEIALDGNGPVLQLEWDNEGAVLAILQHGSPIVKLWDANQGSDTSLDTSQKDLTYLKWASSAPLLAIGTHKGTLVLYDRRSLKKMEIRGKHSKRIISGVWNSSSEVALGSDDKQITISDSNGQTLVQHSLKGEPSNVRFHSSLDGYDSRETTLSAIVASKTVAVFEHDSETLKPVAEASFPSGHGPILTYEWFGTSHICVGFESGYVVVVSCPPPGKGEVREIFTERLFPNGCASMAVSALLSRAAMCSGNQIKVVALGVGDDASGYKELVDEGLDLDAEGGSLEQLQWTRDGQILTVSSDSGVVYNFLASLPVLAATHATKYLYLTSLLELSVIDSLEPSAPPLVVRVAMEPTFVALGPSHVALGMNNHVSFHTLTLDGCPLASEKEYLGTVEAIRLNAEYVAVLSEGRVCLDTLLDADDGGGPISRVFPEAKDQRDVSCIALTADFLIYGTRRGTVVYVHLAELCTVSEYKHDAPIASLYPNQSGTRVVFVDATHAAHLLSPVSESVLPFPKLPAGVKGFLWDYSDPGVLLGYGPQTFSVYTYIATSIQGPAITPIGAGLSYPSPSLSPVLLNNGSVICQQPNGSITTMVLPTHEAIARIEQRGGATPDKIRACFAQNIALGRLTRAWEIANTLKENDLYSNLGRASMHVLDIPLAIRAYRQLGDAGMVMALHKLEGIEDQHLLSGHLALIFDDHATAQDHFLQSTRPIAALEMRRDLLHWEQALKLAKTLAPEQVPTISREFAKQLEFRGQYEQALQMYHKGLGDAPPSSGGPWSADMPHERLCRVGIAKMSIRLGDIGRGVALSLEGGDRDCCRECAAILEGLKQWPEAARLYEVADMSEKAAAIHIKTKNWSAVAPLMSRITSSKLHSEFAKAKEAEGSMQEAVTAYERANDLDSVVRLMLIPPLDQPPRAMSIVRETRSPQGALLVAQHCQAKGEQRGAIEFLVLAKRTADAFEIAAQHDEMDTFTSALGGSGTKEENEKVAVYYEKQGDALKAGEFWFICKSYNKALRLFLQCGERAVEQAIEVVGRARADNLTHMLIDFLMGETDGVPKDPNYIFRLYMALGNYPQAAKTAIIIARQEQELGNYRVAHGILFETHRELTAQRIRVPQELALNLMLLHSYVLVRPLTKMNDHLSGARMLIRVAKHISKFPMHVVPILTSTVIECHRAGLRNSAYEYASMLMRPEYRSQIGEAYKRKIEAIVRKPGDKTDLDEPETPSPFDPNARVAETCLECPSTRNTIPYCAATGRHIVLQDLTMCPSCSFPALFSEFTKMVEAEGMCPMCQQEVALPTIRRMDEEEAEDWLHGATKKENAKRRWEAGGLKAKLGGSGGLGSLVSAAKAGGVEQSTESVLKKAIATGTGQAELS